MILTLFQTIKRMREMSRFSCDTMVYTDGGCMYCFIRYLLQLTIMQGSSVIPLTSFQEI
jgi:hypothetical protein